MKTRWAQYWFTRVRAFMNMTHLSTAGPTLTAKRQKNLTLSPNSVHLPNPCTPLNPPINNLLSTKTKKPEP